jgi:hypothetical protein
MEGFTKNVYVVQKLICELSMPAFIIKGVPLGDRYFPTLLF